MATAVVSQPARATAPGAHDRTFYSGIAIALALTAFVGFARTYYLRSYFGAPPTITGATTLSPIALIHGAVFTGWVLLFVIQTALVATRRVALHRRMGVAGAILAAVMIVIGLTTAISAAASGHTPPGADPLAFLAVPFFDMVLFAGFVSAALLARRNREAHKRLMLLAYVSIITAAIARFPGLFAFGPPVFFGLSLLFIVAGIVYDLASRRRVHPVYIWGGLVLATSIPLRLAISGTGAWRAFAELLVR